MPSKRRVFIYSLATWLGLTCAAVFACGVQNRTKVIVGSMNRSQQAYYLEHQKFAKSFADLGLGVSEQEYNHRYRVIETSKVAFSYGTLIDQSLDPALCNTWCTSGIVNPFVLLDKLFHGEGCKSMYDNRYNYLFCFTYTAHRYCSIANYAGAAYQKKDHNYYELTMASIICEAPPRVDATPVFQNGDYVCPPNAKKID